MADRVSLPPPEHLDDPVKKIDAINSLVDAALTQESIDLTIDDDEENTGQQ